MECVVRNRSRFLLLSECHLSENTPYSVYSRYYFLNRKNFFQFVLLITKVDVFFFCFFFCTSIQKNKHRVYTDYHKTKKYSRNVKISFVCTSNQIEQIEQDDTIFFKFFIKNIQRS